MSNPKELNGGNILAYSKDFISLLDKISSQGNRLKSGDAIVRKDLLAAARELVLNLETPMETIIRWEWNEVNFKSVRFGVWERC